MSKGKRRTEAWDAKVDEMVDPRPKLKFDRSDSSSGKPVSHLQPIESRRSDQPAGSLSDFPPAKSGPPRGQSRKRG